jgi:crotonobetaine/carnitine-CoA ligase
MKGQEEGLPRSDAGPQPRLQLTGTARTVPHLILAGAQHYPKQVAWTDGAVQRRFQDLPELAARGAATLAARGVGPGDRVAVVAANRLEILELLVACSWLGSILVPLNPAMPVAQLRSILQYVEPALIFVDDAQDVRALVSSATSGSTWSGAVLQLPTAADTPASWITAGDAVDALPITPGSTLALLMTSGTTGVSKAVECPHGQFLAWGEGVGNMLGMTAQDIAYTCLPLFHTNALNASFQTMLHGATLHLGPRFSVSKFWQRNAEAGATVGYLLGAMVRMLLSQPPTLDVPPHRVGRILAPGTPVDALKEFESRFGSILIEGHGMTETNAALGTPLGIRQLGYMGRVMPGYQAQVVDDQDVPVSDGTQGELVLRSDIPYAFATGYWRMPEVTVTANRNQWFHSGDRVVAEDGWFRFLDRIKDVIRRRGENISGWEVEQVLDSHDEVARSAAIPVPSELGEDEVMAFVVRLPGSQLTAEHLHRDTADLLPSYARPRFIEFVDELPLTDTGKVRKQVLRDRGVSATTWDAEKSGTLTHG